MSNTIIQKFFSAVLMVSFAVSFAAGALFPRASAQAEAVVAAATAVISVPTSEIGINAVKEAILDGLARIAVRRLLAEITKSIVNLFNIGFEGDPSFLANPQAFFLNTANQITGEIIEKVNPQLCDMFRPQIVLVLKGTRFGEPYQCTALKVLDNIRSFVSDFQNGGWTGWFTILQEENNFYDTAYRASAEQARKIGADKERKRDELAQGQGFLSIKKCKKYDPDYVAAKQAAADNEDNAGAAAAYELSSFKSDGGIRGCAEAEAVTPGKFIAELGINANNIPVNDLTAADEINEALVAIFNALINQMISQGFSSLSGGNGDSGNSGSDWTSADDGTGTFKDKVENMKKNKTEYYNTRKESIVVLNETMSAVDETYTCYSSDPEKYDQEIKNINDIKLAADQTKKQYEQEIVLFDTYAGEFAAMEQKAEKESPTALDLAEITDAIGKLSLLFPVLGDSALADAAKKDLADQKNTLAEVRASLALCRGIAPALP